jgi:hypothetical protein
MWMVHVAHLRYWQTGGLPAHQPSRIRSVFRRSPVPRDAKRTAEGQHTDYSRARTFGYGCRRSADGGSSQLGPLPLFLRSDASSLILTPGPTQSPGASSGSPETHSGAALSACELMPKQSAGVPEAAARRRPRPVKLTVRLAVAALTVPPCPVGGQISSVGPY